MVRNIPRPLTVAEKARADVAADYVTPGITVSFTYTKDTGETSQREGTVIRMMGEPGMSTHAARMDTPEGERTFNLRGMWAVSVQ